MSRIVYLLCVGFLLLLCGCSLESIKRTTYETLQNFGHQKCLKNLSSDCNKKESYDEYQRKRKELEQPASAVPPVK
jgi:hypothetical protein